MKYFTDFFPSLCDCRFIDNKTEKSSFPKSYTKISAELLRSPYSLLFISYLEGSPVGQNPKKKKKKKTNSDIGKFISRHKVISAKL